MNPNSPMVKRKFDSQTVNKSHSNGDPTIVRRRFPHRVTQSPEWTYRSLFVIVAFVLLSRNDLLCVRLCLSFSLRFYVVVGNRSLLTDPLLLAQEEPIESRTKQQ